MTASIRDQLREKGSLRTHDQALSFMRDADSQTLDALVFEVGKKITLPEIAKYIVDCIKGEDRRLKREMINAYIGLLCRLQKLRGEVTEDDAMKMATEEIEDMCVAEGWITKNGRVDSDRRGADTPVGAENPQGTGVV